MMLPPSRHLVLQAIRDFAAENKPVSRKKIARTLGKRDTTVGQHLKWLQRNGFIERQHEGGRWRIVLLDTGQATPWTSRYGKPKKPKGKKRPCLRCGEEFLSEGPHNRMCGPCRSFAEDNDWWIAA